MYALSCMHYLCNTVSATADRSRAGWFFDQDRRPHCNGLTGLGLLTSPVSLARPLRLRGGGGSCPLSVPFVQTTLFRWLEALAFWHIRAKLCRPNSIGHSLFVDSGGGNKFCVRTTTQAIVYTTTRVQHDSSTSAAPSHYVLVDESMVDCTKLKLAVFFADTSTRMYLGGS